MSEKLENLPEFKNKSISLKCPGCHNTIKTITKKKAIARTHITAAVLCMLGCCLIVPCIYCSDCMRTTEHYCPICNKFLGSSNG